MEWGMGRLASSLAECTTPMEWGHPVLPLTLWYQLRLCEESQQGSSKTQHHQLSGSNICLENTPSNNSQNMFLSYAHEHTKKDHILGHKTKTLKWKEMKTQGVLPNRNVVKLESSIRKVREKSLNIQQLNNILLLNNPWVKEAVSRELKKNALNWVKMKIEHNKICDIQLK